MRNVIRVKVIKDENGDHLLEFTDEQMKELGLEVGDTLIWNIDSDTGVVSFRKRDENDN